MDGKYLASNTGPLKVIGKGKVFNVINELLNTNRFKNVEFVAYSIRGSESNIITIDCLFKSKDDDYPTLFYRDFDFYKRVGTIDDGLKSTLEYGVGIGDFAIRNFIELRDFYLEHSKAPVAEIS